MRLTKLLPFFVAIIFVTSGFTQDKKPAVISGVVKDARSKGPLNEAVITLSSTAFQGQKFALTDSSGMYRVSNLPAGKYTVSFEMEGYEKFVQEDIALHEGASLGISFEMIKERKSKYKKSKPDGEKVIAIRKEER